jgi:dihydrofolate synthase/folylpolyglutamate synthase
MTYPETLSYLGQTRRFGMKLGLEPMREIAGALGDPQNTLRFIHLAGTNGKGSTAAFCESCLRASGLRTGLYTSPHLVSVRERIQVDRRPISEAAFVEGFQAVRRAVEATGREEATFFEWMTALALWHFGREGVDWVVWETGLGGRLDATNIVVPEACIITNIGPDHQQYLGESLREIAAEKAGIIKAGVPVISAVEPGEPLEVIRERAAALGSELALIRDEMQVENRGLRGLKQMARLDGRELALGLIGRHQIGNAACAVAAMRRLRVPEEAIARGLENTVWRGRFEILREEPLIVLDGAHNVAGTRSLVETWRNFLGERFGWTEAQIEGRAHLVFAAAADKDITEMARLLRPLAERVSLVRLANERSAGPAQLTPFFSGIPCTCYDSVSAVWQELSSAHSKRLTLITGSLFLVGEMLARRQGNAEECGLNERLEKWSATR